MKINFSTRLAGIGEYYFSQKLRDISKLTNNGTEVINLAIGNPDLPPPPEVIDALKTALTRTDVHGYQPSGGNGFLKSAISDWYQKQFDFLLPTDNILPLNGSKEGVYYISQAFLNPGDRVFIPDPGYPAYTSAANLAGAQADYYDLNYSANEPVNLNILQQRLTAKHKILWINFPHMPSGIEADASFLQKIVRFCIKNQLLLVHDNPYSLILNKTKPFSIFSMPGASDIAIELNSLSKTYNLAGWRLGMLMGSRQIVRQVLKIKSNVDSGQFYGMQAGAAAAMQTGPEWLAALNHEYSQRRSLLHELLDKLDCNYRKDSAGLFIWAELKDKKNDSAKFSEKLLAESAIWVAPGILFGRNGRHHIRVSLCVDQITIKKAIKRIK